MKRAVGQADWVVRAVEGGSSDGIDGLARDLLLSPVVARLLWQRDIRTPSRARRFLSPRLADLSPPGGLPGMEQAADRLAQAVREGERIAVCGDYDVDGMTGTAVLVRFLRIAGGDVIWSIPDRDLDGYGLSLRAIDVLHERGTRVAVTVDNGMTAYDAIDRAAEHGMDVVVTDHHLPGDRLPQAVAIVNPHVRAKDEPARDPDGEPEAPCGCTLAFKLAWAVADRLRTQFGQAEERFRAFLRDAVGLAAMATVTDAVPLRGENRILVSAGLASLRRSTHPGIKALLEVAKLGRTPLTTEDIGFKLGPRLNAAGRLSMPEVVIELLTTDDSARAKELAQTLDDANTRRREIENDVREAAETQAEQLLAAGDRNSIVVWGEGWHQGVIGIVASRLVDRFGKPAVVIGLKEGQGRGSGRTTSRVNLHSAFTACAPHLGRYGGHAAAAGLEVTDTNVHAFRDAFEEAATAQLEGDVSRREIHIDAESHVDEWDLSSVQMVRRLAPFGQANPEPVFLLRGAEIAGEPRLMGATSAHLSFALKQTGGAIRVIAFRRADLFDLAASGHPLDLAVVPCLNEWRGHRSAEFRLVDMRAHDAGS